MCRVTAAVVARHPRTQRQAHVAGGHPARRPCRATPHRAAPWQTARGHPKTGVGELTVDAPVARLVGIGPRTATARTAHTQVNARGAVRSDAPGRSTARMPCTGTGQTTERAEGELAARGRDQTANGVPGRARHDMSEHPCATGHPCRPGQFRQTGQSRSRHSHREHLGCS